MLNFFPRDEKYFDQFSELARRIHDVIDLIDGTVRRLILFGITEPTPIARRLSEVIVAATEELVEAVGALRKQKGVIEHCIQIKKLENEGDVAYHEAVASLFRGKVDPIEVI